MASLKDSMNEVTNLCSICLEQYKLPVILPCSHSFCQACLAAHIKSSCVKLNPPLGFPCPLDRVFIPAPGRIGQYSTDEWATKFPENKLLAAASVSPESTISCKPYEEDGEEVMANSWCIDCSETLCETCVKCHKKSRPSRHHVVVSLSDGLNTCKEPESLENCETHDGRKLDLFCKKHLIPCCTICVTKEHSNCNSLCQIEEVHANLVGPQKLEFLQSEVEKFCATLEQTIQEEKTNIDNIDDVSNKCTKELSELTQAIIQSVKCLEEKHLDEIAKLSKEAKSKLRQSVESFEQRLQYICHWKDILMKNKGTSQTNTVLSYTKIKNIFEDLRKLNYSKLGISIQNKFPEKAQKLKTLSCLAEITADEHWNDIKFNQGKLNLATATVKTIHILERNLSGTFIRGGDFLNNGKLVLADGTKKKIIICNIDGILTVLQEKELPAYPYGVCASGENEVLVTLPDEKKVLRLDSDSLDIIETVSLSCVCYEIVTSGNIAVIGTNDSVVMLSGSLDERRCTTVSSELKCTTHVAFDNENNLIYSSYSKNKVRKQDKMGNILFSYTHEKLIYPYGLAVSRNGEIFVNGFSSNNVHILSKNGKLLRILEGVNNPTWVKYHDDTNRLFIMEDGSNLKVLAFTPS